MKKKKIVQKKLLRVLVLLLIIIVALGATYVVQKLNNRFTADFTIEKAQELIDDTIKNLPTSVSSGGKYIVESASIKVTDLDYGSDKNIILTCSYSSPNVAQTIEQNLQKYLTTAYDHYYNNTQQNIKTNATKIKLLIVESLKLDLEKAEILSGTTTIEIYETAPEQYQVYLSDETVNTLLGGIVDAIKSIKSATTVEYKGEVLSIQNLNTLRTGISDCIALKNYDSTLPDTSIPLEKAWNKLCRDFYRNFIEKDRYTYLTRGLATTLSITFCAVLLGILIGFIVAIIRCTNQKTGKLDLLSDICKIYLSIMRGTPVMVQLLIFYFVVLLPLGVDKFIAAVLCFGLNSGAYVSEIIRGGIMAIDEGQTEAGRSLGFNYIQTMYYIIIPQAFKAVLPALANEFIALLKESSIAFYIGIADLTMGGIKIRSLTYSNFMPLISIAVIYLIVVLGLSKCVSILERRLSKGDKR